MNARRWEQIGAVSGLLFVALLVATFFTAGTPDPDESTAEIARQVADDRTELLFNAYVGGLATIFLVVFIAVLWSVLRRAERAPGPSILARLGGLGTAAGVLVANGVTLALVYAAEDNREPAAIRALFELDSDFFIPIGFMLALLYAGTALSVLSARSLPSWLGWAAAALALAFLVGLLGMFSEEEDGGALGILFFIGFLGTLVWVLATSIVMLLRAGGRRGAAGSSRIELDPSG